MNGCPSDDFAAHDFTAFIAHFVVFPAGWNRFYLVTYCVLVVVAARSAKRASESP